MTTQALRGFGLPTALAFQSSAAVLGEPAEWLDGMPAVRAVAMIAPPGYGKQRLMTHWQASLADAGARTAWLRPPEIGPQLARLADLSAADRPLFLFVDLDGLGDDGAAAVLSWMAQRPAHWTLFMSMRQLGEGLLPPCFGNVLQLGVEDLGLDAAAIAAVLAEQGLACPRALAALIHARTGGWPEAVNLLCRLAPGHGGLDRALAALPDTLEWQRFLDRHVLAELSSALSDFLHRISIAERLTPALCRDLHDSPETARLWDEAVARQLLLPVESQAGLREMQMAPMLRLPLQARLQADAPQLRRGLERRASLWYLDQGRHLEAYHHAIRGQEPERAATILEPHCDTLWHNGLEAAVLPSLTLLPLPLRTRFPRLLLAMSWRCMIEWRLDEARALIDRVEAMIADEPAATGSGAIPLATEIRHRRVMLAVFEEDHALIDRLYPQLVVDLQDAPPYLLGSLHTARMHAQTERFQLARHDRLALTARTLLEETGSRVMRIYSETFAATGNMMRGQIRTAEEILRKALTEAEAGTDPGLSAAPALLLAQILNDRNDMETARALVETHLPHALATGFTPHIVAGLVTATRIAFAQGRTEDAARYLEQAEAFAAGRDLVNLQVHARCWGLFLAARTKDGPGIARAAEALELPRSPQSLLPRSHSTRTDSVRARAWVVWQRVTGGGRAALELARKWHNHLAAAGARLEAMEWQLQLALLLAATGDQTQARRSFLRAVAQAEPMGFTRAFLDEAEWLRDLVLAEDTAPAGEADRFRHVLSLEILAAGGSPGTAPARAAAPPPVEPQHADDLSPREAEILQMLGNGLRNAEIGRRLGMTEGSVKWHLQRIYDKIGVRRRVLAIEYARRIKLIA